MHNEAGSARRLNDNRQRFAARFHRGLSRNRFPRYVDEYETLLTDNRIWKQRTVGIGVVTPERAKALGFTGPMLRGSGVEWDLRKKQPYEVYDRMDFDIPVGVNGDCYDRYLVRIEEMPPVQPHRQAVHRMAAQESGSGHHRQPQGRAALARGHEDQHGRADPSFQALHRRHARAARAKPTPQSKHPKGEFGIYLVSDGANKPYRLKIRAPGFPHLAALDEMARGHMIADVVAIIGTQDIVFGEK